MTPKNVIKAVNLLLLTFVLVYPSVVFAFKNDAGLSYCVTSVIFVLPLIGVIAFIKKKWLFIVVAILFSIIAIAELTMVDLYGQYFLPGSIYSFIRTNPQEAGEFYHSNIKEIFNWSPIILLCIVSCFLFKSIKITKVNWIILCGGIMISTFFVGYKLVGFYDSKMTIRYYVDRHIWNRPPYNIFYQSIQTKKEINNRNKIEQAANVNFGASRVEPNVKKEIYVLAIGESLRYDNLSLNGTYSRSTTPRLEKIENIVLFDNYYSQACLTMYSIPQLVTRATPDNYELNFAERSIIEPYRECGFKTFAIVNSNLLSYEKYLTNGVDSLIIVSNIVENGKILQGDKTIVSIVDSLVQKYDKLFLILQFLGNHSFFTNYEAEFDVYQPNSNNHDGKRCYQTLINAYDNSILYTDYILTSLIDKINIPNAISAMIFVSDHGEEIRGDGAGHGGNCSPVIEEYHVPFIFWYSQTYEDTYPAKVKMSIQHKKAKINGDCIFYSVCDMANIKLESNYWKETWSVLSPNFREHQRLILMPDGVTVLNPDK